MFTHHTVVRHAARLIFPSLKITAMTDDYLSLDDWHRCQWRREQIASGKRYVLLVLANELRLRKLSTEAKIVEKHAEHFPYASPLLD